MTARALPVMPNFFAGQKLTGTLMNQVGTYGVFWADKPMFRMYQSIGQSIPNTVDTQVTCDTSHYDTDSGRQGTSPYNYVIPPGMNGRWRFTWAVSMVNNSVGARDAYIKVNGNRIAGPEAAGAAASNDVTQAFGMTTIPVSAGDVISLWIWQNSGGALSTVASSNNVTVFEGELVSLANP